MTEAVRITGRSAAPPGSHEVSHRGGWWPSRDRGSRQAGAGVAGEAVGRASIKGMPHQRRKRPHSRDIACSTPTARTARFRTGRWLCNPWWVLGALTGLVYGLPVLLVTLTPLRWNLSASMPQGLYRFTHEPLGHGAIVGVCLPPSISQLGWERGYLSTRVLAVWGGECPSGDQPLLKTVRAVAGDTVEIQPEAVTINGERIVQSATLAVDSAGRALPHVPWGTYTLTEGEVWVMSTYQVNSWDARYFGPLAVTDVYATARPVWVRHPQTTPQELNPAPQAER